ncbi:MAG: phosphotransferase, partial [Clostridiales bacterium]|nr:phosphotransferase [Clostridiales bacterium]
IKRKISSLGGNPERETLTIVRTKDNKGFYQGEDGDCWRSYLFIEEAQAYQKVENPIHFYNAGKAFGKFVQYLEDYQAENLYETIPDFHNTRKRYEDFMEAIRVDKVGRVSEVQAEIKFVMKRADDTKRLTTLLKQGMLPIRVTHNDTKFNNILIDNVTKEGLCVIDLDTVMPGLMLYDFGDAIRSGASTAMEDEVDLSKVWLDLDLFESFTHGFMKSAGNSITEAELELLPFSAKLLTFECGMRFLGDYLNGDIYFKIDKEKHNLDRARNQFKLVSDMEKNSDQMIQIMETVKKIDYIRNVSRKEKETEDFWDLVPSLPIKYFPWNREDGRQTTEVKLAYTDTDLRVLFMVKEAKIKADYLKINDPVYKDSCVEFFFNPNPQKDKRYLNFECNAIVAFLLQIGEGRENRKLITEYDEAFFQIKTSVNRENKKDYKKEYWQLEYSIPFTFLEKYYGKLTFESGYYIMGNFYKCCDEAQNPQYVVTSFKGKLTIIFF